MSARMIIESLETRRLLSSSLIADVGGFYPTEAVTLNGVSYFAANDGTHGNELWKSNGTPSGTKIVADVIPGATGSRPTNLAVFGDSIIFFTSSADGSHSLWISKGTAATTQLVQNFAADVAVSPGVVANGQFTFVTKGVSSVDAVEVWTSDGSTVGTSIVKKVYDDVPAIGFGLIRAFVYHDRAVFYGNDIVVSDGTTQGTFVMSHQSDSLCFAVTVLNDKLIALISYQDGISENSDLQVVQSDGTPGGTTLVKHVGIGGQGVMTVFNGKAYFFVVPDDQSSIQLWSTDGTANGTAPIVSLLHGAVNEPVGLPDGRLLFATHGTNYDAQIWVTDGTQAGTSLLKGLPPETYVSSFVTIDDARFFLASSAEGAGNLCQLWRTDGTVQGTVLIKDYSGKGLSWRNTALTNVDNRLVVTLGRRTEILDPATMTSPGGPIKGAISFSNGTLRILGTRRADSISLHLAADDPTRLIVQVNGLTKTYRASNVKSITIYGYAGNDAINFDESLGQITASSHIWAGAGNDNIHTGHGRDSIWGEDGNDRISSGHGNDVDYGGNGDDVINAGNGNDTACGNAGADKIGGGNGADVIGGGQDSSNDQLDGGGGVDVIFGNAVYEIFYRGIQDSDPLDDVLLS